MNYEITRVYRTIIEDVIKSLENESLYTNIDISVIDDLKSDWLDKINEYTDLTKIDELREGVSLNVDENGYIEQKDEEMIDSGCLESSETADEDSGENYLMCLYVKVSKSKNKWKCSFKDGFINIGPLDFAFSTGQGDLYW